MLGFSPAPKVQKSCSVAWQYSRHTSEVWPWALPAPASPARLGKSEMSPLLAMGVPVPRRMGFRKRQKTRSARMIID